MNVRNCRRCGKIFNYVMGPAMCPACKDEMEKIFQGVKKYVQDHKGVTIHDVAEACEVDPQQIRQWIREERLEFSDDSMIGIGCEVCGATIKSGRFCEKCKAQLANGLTQSISPRKTQTGASDTDTNSLNNNKMRYLK